MAINLRRAEAFEGAGVEELADEYAGCFWQGDDREIAKQVYGRGNISA